MVALSHKIKGIGLFPGVVRTLAEESSKFHPTGRLWRHNYPTHELTEFASPKPRNMGF